MEQPSPNNPSKSGQNPLISGHFTGITGWLTGSVLILSLLGSLALLAVFREQARREEERMLEAQVAANVAFFDRTSFFPTPQLAAQLGDVLGMRVFFRNSDRETTWKGAPGVEIPSDLNAVAQDGMAHRLPGKFLGCATKLKQGGGLLFLRQETSGVAALRRTDTWTALGILWLLSLLAGVVLARRVAKPLRKIAGMLPNVAGNTPISGLDTQRRDEIGLISQALISTRETLHEERDRRRAAERLAVLGKMAASLAHEVRNPASAIQLHAQLLEGSVAQDREVSRECILEEARRIESLVRQWMTFARPEPPRLAPMDLVEFLRATVKRFQPQADHAGVTLKLECPETGPVARMDRPRMEQALGNVIMNAIQALPLGGIVSIETGNMTANKTWIAVEDTGGGFSKEAQNRATEPFFSEKEGGMGLGLAVAEEVCQAHGGTLALGNTAIGGGRVTLTFSTTPTE
jgi:signal transduction histidine kinase